MVLEAGNKYKLRRLKDLYCNYIFENRHDYLFSQDGTALLNHQMDSIMGQQVTVKEYFANNRYIIEECTHSNFHVYLFEEYEGNK